RRGQDGSGGGLIRRTHQDVLGCNSHSDAPLRRFAETVRVGWCYAATPRTAIEYVAEYRVSVGASGSGSRYGPENSTTSYTGTSPMCPVRSAALSTPRTTAARFAAAPPVFA